MNENRKIILMVVTLFFGMCLSPSIIGLDETVPTLGNTLYVGGSGSGNYTRIQDAIDNASNGDTVFVFDDSSPFYENVVIDKSINLVGEDKNTTIIDGGGYGDVIEICVCEISVTINGFTIQNSGHECDYWQDSGIFILSNSYTIYDNNIVDNYWGIIIISGTGCTIKNNQYGIRFSNPSSPHAYNYVIHNNFINNARHAYADWIWNFWDDGYPSGGNYWDDYSGSDNYHGPGQNIPGSDGIGDTPYTITSYSHDRYPMMKPYSIIPPEITDVLLTTSDPLDTEPGFGWENVTCTVTDDVAVATVKLVVTNDTATVEHIMTNIPGTDTDYYNTTLTDAGRYNYYIWADDASGNDATSETEIFWLPANWDVNMDGRAYLQDFVIVAGYYGETGSPGWIREDVNNDGKVYLDDFVIIAGHYGEEW